MGRAGLVGGMAFLLMAQGQPQPQAPRPAPSTPAPARPAPQIPTRLNAQTLTGLCGQDRGSCLTYVLGVTDAYASALVASARPQIFCVPRGTSNDQIAQAVVRYLRAHPEEGATNASLVVLSGLKAAYPCGY